MNIKKAENQDNITYTIPSVGDLDGVIITVTIQKADSLNYSVNYDYTISPPEFPTYHDFVSQIENGNIIET